MRKIGSRQIPPPPIGDLLQHPCLRHLEEEVMLSHMCGYFTLLKTGAPLDSQTTSWSKKRKRYTGATVYMLLLLLLLLWE